MYDVPTTSVMLNQDILFVETLLVRAAYSAPNLTYLRITRTSGIPESWLVPIQRYARLERVDLLEPMYDSSASCTPALGAEAGFGSLRELHLYGKFAALQDATDLLRSVSSPHLRSLRVDSCECRTDAFAEALRDFCAVLRSKFASALEVVVLSVYGIGPEVTLERPLAEYLHLLLQVRGVKDVRLSLAPNGVIVAVSEADVSAMADSWPRLERLHLDCASFKSRGGGGLPRQVVDRMVLACPLLEDIRLPIDADSEVDTSTLPTRGEAYAYAASYPFSATKPVLRPCCASVSVLPACLI
ncbi:hypothetical protein C8T65DRAFT_751208 [Cerioporus squamosus]|nr:hypothetical protein C8T65DRAFT_751208 [Cerioporus squamosus]